MRKQGNIWMCFSLIEADASFWLINFFFYPLDLATLVGWFLKNPSLALIVYGLTQT